MSDETTCAGCQRPIESRKAYVMKGGDAFHPGCEDPDNALLVANLRAELATVRARCAALEGALRKYPEYGWASCDAMSETSMRQSERGSEKVRLLEAEFKAALEAATCGTPSPKTEERRRFDARYAAVWETPCERHGVNPCWECFDAWCDTALGKGEG